MNRDPAGGLNAAVSAILRGELSTAGITYDALAKQIHVSKATITRLLKPKPTRDMDIGVFYDICVAVNETPDVIMRRALDRLAKLEHDDGGAAAAPIQLHEKTYPTLREEAARGSEGLAEDPPII